MEKHCLRCGHSWTARTAEPLYCPKCKSPYWDKPRLPRSHAEAQR